MLFRVVNSGLCCFLWFVLLEVFLKCEIKMNKHYNDCYLNHENKYARQQQHLWVIVVGFFQCRCDGNYRFLIIVHSENENFINDCSENFSNEVKIYSFLRNYIQLLFYYAYTFLYIIQFNRFNDYKIALLLLFFIYLVKIYDKCKYFDVVHCRRFLRQYQFLK